MLGSGGDVLEEFSFGLGVSGTAWLTMDKASLAEGPSGSRRVAMSFSLAFREDDWDDPMGGCEWMRPVEARVVERLLAEGARGPQLFCQLLASVGEEGIDPQWRSSIEARAAKAMLGEAARRAGPGVRRRL